MKRRNLFVLAAVVAAMASPVLGADRYVVLISIDGLAASYFGDPRAHLPTLRQMSREGAHANGMVVTFPSATWPSHTTMVTGVSPSRHGILGNSVFDRAANRTITYLGDPELTKAECVRVPTIYDAVHQAGMKTAAVIWPATVGAPTLDWTIPDTAREPVLTRFTTVGLSDELAKAGISIGMLPQWGWKKEHSGARDLTYARVTEHLLKTHRPNLTLLHLITPDGHQHNYGPRSDEGYWAVSYGDDRVRQIRDVLNQPPFAGKSTLIVVSDHGFAEYTKTIYPNVLLKQMGLLTVDNRGAVTARKAWFESGSGGVYFLEKGPSDLKARLAAVEGVDRVLSAEQFHKLGLPDPATNPQQADLMLSAKEGYTFSNDAKGDLIVSAAGERRGTHGHLPDQPFMYATFVAAGSGIRKGARLEKISSMDIAPTIAALLGVKLPGAEGRVLVELLQRP